MKRLTVIIIVAIVLTIVVFVSGYLSKDCFDCRLHETRNANRIVEPKQPVIVEYEANTYDCQNGVCLFKREIQIE